MEELDALPLDDDGRKIGRMRVSLERDLYKQVDVQKVARGQFLTREPRWLVEPVREFIAARLDRCDAFLDPFAGEGHLLEAVQTQFGKEATGYDIQAGRWFVNDSLLSVPRAERAMVVTNPPYLAKHSARRKGVLSLARDYYRESGRDDLYMVALDRCRDAADFVVALVPETFILSAYPKEELVSVVVIEDMLFNDTDSPIAVVCFDRHWRGDPRVYVGSEEVGTLTALMALRPTERDRRVPMRFNDPDGRVGLRAVDGVYPEDRVRFMLAAQFPYSRSSIKHSSRLMTYVELPGVRDQDLPAVLEEANALLEDFRTRSRDLILAPFKGNNKAGVRRRRLDYAMARHIVTLALSGRPYDAGSQLPLFSEPIA